MRFGGLLVLVLLLQSLGGQVLLKAPFGRTWGEEPTALLQWAGELKMDVFVELPADRPGLEIFTFKKKGGIPGHTADTLEARYHNGKLYEVTVSYEFPGRTPDEVRTSFHKMKDALEKRHGKFRLNGRGQNADDGFLTREESYHFEPSPGVFLLMAYSSVEDTLRKKGQGSYSLLYHNGRLAPPRPGVLPKKE
ncbi:hypothetical protein [Roseibacillus persicicus]|uniref:hypothetical protein n=1 Tax=Roseibacillus persicicus TaxID=454148 RepID=UPI00280DEE2D|nr:hypothetical protein [Roseibacillus persicicus]MDQ8192185.1 hypothetical protein [Roseibacillus persicicus]